jgi:two-component system cell cycle sensor histidine kinase/response regulator CckA
MRRPATPELGLQLLESLPIGVTMWQLEEASDDPSLRLLFGNSAAGRMGGFDPRACIGKPLEDVLPSGLSAHRSLYAAVCQDGVARDIGVFGSLDENESASTVALVATPLPGRCVALVSHNLTELHRAEEETHDVHQFLDSIIEQVPAMIFVKDARDLKFERFNRAGEELLGRNRHDLLGKNDYDFFPAEQAEAFVSMDHQVLNQGTLHDIPEEPIDTPHGTRWLHTRKIPLLDRSGRPRHLLGISIDITERKQAEQVLRASHLELEQRVQERTRELEQQIEETQRAQQALALTQEQLRQSQKMEAIGRLAGGIAHDFNNLLSVVLGYSELILARLPHEDALYSKVEEIKRAGGRAAELTRQLLAFSRRQMLQPRVLDLNEVIQGMGRMLPRILGEDIVLRLHTERHLGRVKADPSQIEQVIMNLVVNARDAMPTGGELLIQTAETDLTAKDLSDQLVAQPGKYAVLTVRDTGVGMNREVLQRVFEPFFTTKELGKGTGLGLSTVFGIVQQSGGLIRVESQPRHGSTFRIYLPVTHEQAAEHRRAPGDEDEAPGHETVLIVEDDDQVRRLAAEVLRGLGYSLLEARSAAQALSLAKTHHGPIDLLLTDVVMPEMGGGVLAEKMREARPSLRVLFMSGYTDDAVLRHGIMEEGVPFLQKPLTPNMLARGVRDILEANACSGPSHAAFAHPSGRV